jgi:hypothetical protein
MPVGLTLGTLLGLQAFLSKAWKGENVKYEHLGELPAGNWEFKLLIIPGLTNVLLILDETGDSTPRMIIRGKLVEVDFE